MKQITFHYDAMRTLHVHVMNWLRTQVTCVAVDFENNRIDGQVKQDVCGSSSFWAVTDDGNVYCGKKAWLMALWVTYDHRMTALRIAATDSLDRAMDVCYRLARA